MDVPVIMEQLSPIHVEEIEAGITLCSYFPGLREIFSDADFIRIFQAHHEWPGLGLASEFIKQWIIKHQNPTWEALVALLRAIQAHGAARKIESIIPTMSPPVLEHTALKKK